MSFVIVYVTVSTETEAQRIAETVVGERLAACANILPPIRSIYWWEGKLESAGEVAVLLKTRETLADPLIERVRELHSYECPCIVAMPLVAGNPAFVAWIGSETRG